MIIYPATDIKDGKVVRLTQGDYNQVQVFSDEPYKVAKEFEEKGATWLHIVDLDGAKDGTLLNFEAIKKIVENTSLKIEVGGGIRNEERIKKYLEIGISKVILGTAAVNDFSFLEKMAKKYKEKIILGVDAKNGFVAVDGWTNTTTIDSYEFCIKAKEAGVQNIIYTDISKDGKMEGTNMPVYKKLSGINGVNIVASGGVKGMNEIVELKQMGVSGIIIGKAIYLGAIELEEAIKEAGNDN